MYIYIHNYIHMYSNYAGALGGGFRGLRASENGS